MSRRTKIVATLGPKTSDPSTVLDLLQAGVDVVRINASHGDHKWQESTIQVVRQCGAQLNRSVGILYDLQGPKIRVGQFSNSPRSVKTGEMIRWAVGRTPAPDELPTDYPNLDKDLRKGEPLLVDDGKIAMEVVDVQAGTVTCRVLNQGEILPRKGINLPKSNISVPAVTDKDQEDALFALSKGVDTIALSFVRSAKDIWQLRKFLEQHHFNPPIVAKIEKPQALENLGEILECTWGVMVARGDLGVELSPEDVPVAQKRIIREAVQHGRPVITATQMLESMTHHIRPTRAEASDVANAVLDGTDAVMLSGETAVGDFPIETVAMMDRIIRATEVNQPENISMRRRDRSIETAASAISDAGCYVAQSLGAKALVAFTESGQTAILAAKLRPKIPILAFAPDFKIRNALSMVWGVHPQPVQPTSSIEARISELDQVLQKNGDASLGDIVVLMMGAAGAPTGSTNLIMVHRIGQQELKDSAT